MLPEIDSLEKELNKQEVNRIMRNQFSQKMLPGLVKELAWRSAQWQHSTAGCHLTACSFLQYVQAVCSVIANDGVKVWLPAAEENGPCSSGRAGGLLFGGVMVWVRRGIKEVQLLKSECEGNLLTRLSQKKSNFISESAFQQGGSDGI